MQHTSRSHSPAWIDELESEIPSQKPHDESFELPHTTSTVLVGGHSNDNGVGALDDEAPVHSGRNSVVGGADDGSIPDSLDGREGLASVGDEDDGEASEQLPSENINDSFAVEYRLSDIDSAP